MIVVDASAVIDLVLDTTPQSDAVAERLREHRGDVHAPHLLDAEVGQVLRRYVLARSLSVERALRAVDFLAELEIFRYEHLAFLPRALGLRANLTVYDALYVVLAEALGAPLLTRDRAIAERAGGMAEVILLP